LFQALLFVVVGHVFLLLGQGDLLLGMEAVTEGALAVVLFPKAVAVLVGTQGLAVAVALPVVTELPVVAAAVAVVVGRHKALILALVCILWV
jgi:hypothetical protein